MIKEEFVGLVQKSGEYKTKKEAEAAIKAFTDAVTSVLVEKDSISLVGFGSFETMLQKAKSGKVPGTNKNYVTQDKIVPKFKAGKALKDRVAAGK